MTSVVSSNIETGERTIRFTLNKGGERLAATRYLTNFLIQVLPAGDFGEGSVSSGLEQFINTYFDGTTSRKSKVNFRASSPLGAHASLSCQIAADRDRIEICCGTSGPEARERLMNAMRAMYQEFISEGNIPNQDFLDAYFSL